MIVGYESEKIPLRKVALPDKYDFLLKKLVARDELIAAIVRDLAWVRDEGMKDFLIEVAKGNVEGHETLIVIGTSETVGATYTDIWDEGGIRTDITAAESWELVCADAADDAAGIGARLIQVVSLDANHDVQENFIVTNGGTTAIPGTHIGSRRAIVVGAGSNNTNVGDIRIQVAGGGDVRQRIAADEGRANNSHFTVPNGKVAFPIQFSFNSPKNEDAVLRNRLIIGSLNNKVRTSSGFLPTYQSSASNPVMATAGFPAKSEFWFQVKTNSPGTKTIMINSEFLIVDVALTEQAGVCPVF